VEEDDDDEYAKLVRRMNPPRYTYTDIHDCSCMYSCLLLLMPFEFLYCSLFKIKNFGLYFYGCDFVRTVFFSSSTVWSAVLRVDLPLSFVPIDI